MSGKEPQLRLFVGGPEHGRLDWVAEPPDGYIRWKLKVGVPCLLHESLPFVHPPVLNVSEERQAWEPADRVAWAIGEIEAMLSTLPVLPEGWQYRPMLQKVSILKSHYNVGVFR